MNNNDEQKAIEDYNSEMELPEPSHPKFRVGEFNYFQ